MWIAEKYEIPSAGPHLHLMIINLSIHGFRSTVYIKDSWIGLFRVIAHGKQHPAVDLLAAAFHGELPGAGNGMTFAPVLIEPAQANKPAIPIQVVQLFQFHIPHQDHSDPLRADRKPINGAFLFIHRSDLPLCVHIEMGRISLCHPHVQLLIVLAHHLSLSIAAVTAHIHSEGAVKVQL